MLKPPFEQVHVKDVSQIVHGNVSKGYYLASFNINNIIDSKSGSNNMEVYFAVETEALEMLK